MSKQTAKKETAKQEFNMVQVFTMWIKKSKNGTNYLSGLDQAGNRLVGYFNGKKQNPKEPDIRIYHSGEEGKGDEYTSLWVNVSKNDKKYLSGKVGGKKVVGFLNTKAKINGKVPYFSVYESDGKPQEKEEVKTLMPTDKDGFINIPDGIDEELPFA